jgi:hypothetical protein
VKIDRRTYADHYGPTTGDRIRLADTDLIVQIEHDAASYGDEAKFGGGKVIRDGMGQSATASRQTGSPDLVITNVVIIDAEGIRKADVGIRDGLISAIGKAGNPLAIAERVFSGFPVDKPPRQQFQTVWRRMAEFALLHQFIPHRARELPRRDDADDRRFPPACGGCRSRRGIHTRPIRRSPAPATQSRAMSFRGILGMGSM